MADPTRDDLERVLWRVNGYLRGYGITAKKVVETDKGPVVVFTEGGVESFAALVNTNNPDDVLAQLVARMAQVTLLERMRCRGA